jgi:poly(3-hydroxybutyrate) depolymerase
MRGVAALLVGLALVGCGGGHAARRAELVLGLHGGGQDARGFEAGRHAWPPLGGPAGIGIDGAEEIWRFFAVPPSRG